MDIIITDEIMEDGFKTITGEFSQFNGWSFAIELYPEPQNSDCWACSSAFITDVRIYHNGEEYYASPTYEYDNIAVHLTEDHYAMFAAIDNRFSG